MKIFIVESRGNDYESSWVIEKAFAKREDAEMFVRKEAMKTMWDSEPRQFTFEEVSSSSNNDWDITELELE